MKLGTDEDLASIAANLLQLRDRLSRALAESRLLREQILRASHEYDLIPLRLVLQRLGAANHPY
jgi:hypothetical protein